MQARSLRLNDRLPFSCLSDKSAQLLLSQAHIATLPPDSMIYHEGDTCNQYLIVLEGYIRVQKVTDSGHEITLFRIEPGQSCKLTGACLLGGDQYPAEAITETRTTLLKISKQHFHHLITESEEFRRLVFASIDVGMNGLVSLIEDVAFGHLDKRLARTLLQRSPNNDTIYVTHRELAIELGTAREVVSRLLKEFERHGWINLSRGRIGLTNPDALTQI